MFLQPLAVRDTRSQRLFCVVAPSAGTASPTMPLHCVARTVVARPLCNAIIDRVTEPISAQMAVFQDYNGLGGKGFGLSDY